MSSSESTIQTLSFKEHECSLAADKCAICSLGLTGVEFTSINEIKEKAQSLDEMLKGD